MCLDYCLESINRSKDGPVQTDKLKSGEWIETSQGWFRIPDQIIERSQTPKSQYDNIKISLSDKIGSYDFSGAAATQAILFYNRLVIII